ncbi:MAG: VWA domain-containing protein [Myxococcales bacterium]|nr:VWA domain-containing protein [Myxococcales bacterium]HIL80256.1 VWA domain-containing protein [Myxococcales bacterium]
MQKKVIEFVNLLRKSGIRVSVAEGIDAFNALDELSLDDRDVFRDALRSAMVKRGDEIATYDELFDLFWSGYYDNLKSAFGDMEGDLGEMGIDLEQLLAQLAEMMENMDGDLNLGELAKAMLTQNLAELENMIRQAAEQAGTERIENMLQVGFFSRRTTEQLGMEGAAQELEALADRMRAQGMGDEAIAQMQELIRKLMETVRRSVRNFTERELQQQNHNYMEKFRREMLTEKSFYHLTEDEILRMREVVTRLAQRIKNILSIRKKRLKKGKLDLHQTLRRNMARGGIPFEVIYKTRRKERPKLVIMCDVSSSVANVSRFMLQFMYSLQEAFTKIRCYVFVAELGEVTDVFHDGDVSSAVEKALDGGDVINVYTRSNFGFAFHEFWKNHLAAIDNKTTVIILGDARNNYNDARAWCVRDIQNKAKNLVWLNPESPSAWGFGDSVMDRYMPYCDVVEECRNLRQLSKVVDQIVL